MLKKLFKHDFKNISRLMIPATVLLLAITVIGCAARVGINCLSWDVAKNLPDYLNVIITSSLQMVVVASVLSIVAYVACVLIAVYARYYKNFFTDEGYLTFTLPVKSHTLLFSKVFSSILWITAAVIVALLMGITMAGFSDAPEGRVFNIHIYKQLFDMLNTLIFDVNDSIGILIWGILTFITEAVSEMLIIFLAITIGSVVAKKAKIAASVGFYFALHTGMQLLSSGIAIIAGLIGFGVFADEMTSVTDQAGSMLTGYMSTLLATLAVFYAVAVVVEFLVINKIIKKNINLE